MIIARNNIDRYLETGEIDVEYLKGLSYEAVPEMVRIAGDKEFGDEVVIYLGDKKVELEGQDNWQSLNYSRVRASKIIDKYIK